MTPNIDPARQARDILDTHHALLKRELPRLEAAFKDAPLGLRQPFERLCRTMESHLMKEEQILFPAIFELCERGEMVGCGLYGPIRQMEHEHQEIRAIEAELRGAARHAGALERDLVALLDDLAEHARKEDEELFPAALTAMEAHSERAAPPPAEDDDDELERIQPLPAAREQTWSEAQVAVAAETARRPPPRETLRRTRGVCPECHKEVRAEVVVRDGEVYLEKHCEDHGIDAQLLSRSPDYWAKLDRFYFQVNQRSYPQRDFIVRMTERCNLACPICLAKANTEDTPDLDLSGLETLLSERRGIKIDLMAAEPTLRPDLEDWVRKVKASGNIAALHTNGLKLANREYARKMKEAGVDEVFLQFDGMDDQANTALRGRPLLKARKAALANLRELGIATSLIVVIARELNEAQVGETFRMALEPENDHIREVFFLGLRMLGSARYSGRFVDQALMPDELIDLLVAQEPRITRDDVRDFNLIYFAMLSAFQVKKCLYVQHYMVARDGHGGYTPVSDILDLGALARAGERYAARMETHPTLARAELGGSLIRQGLRPSALRHATDLVKLEQLFEKGMNLGQVPSRFLLLGFITACDPHNYDAQVAINCGKGELSTDGGFTECSAAANVRREARFDQSDRDPGRPFKAPEPGA